MRIGVITYHCQPNFGAQLQAISTIGYLKQKGHEAIVLDWYAKDLEEMYFRRIPQVQIDCHAIFTKECLPLSHHCSTEEELIAEVNRLHLDAIIAGSDALFKYIPDRTRRYFSKKKLRFIYYFTPLSCEQITGNPFFGSFLGQLDLTIPASVYAASCQNCQFEELTRKEVKILAQALSHYRMISVRDTWTQKMIRHVTHRNSIPIFPDPVFSFRQNCYLAIPTQEEILLKYALPKNYVLISFRGKRTTLEYVLSIANELKKRGLEPVALPMPEGLFSAGIEKRIELPLSPLDWYALIIYSKGYIGERMHPIVVCLHNAIPFYSFDEYGTQVKKSFFSKEKVYDASSSKTKLIVTEAGLIDNLYSYQGGQSLPSAFEVVNRLISFDIKRCQAFSVRKHQEYETGMEQILKSLV